MKYSFYTSVAILVVLVVTSCEPAAPDETLTTLNIPSAESVLTLVPAYSAVPEKTSVYFLIDNSNSIKRECGELDGRRFDFVSYILNILNTIPEPLSHNLYIGAGSFGNDSGNHVSIIFPELVSPSLQLFKKPDNTGDYQNYSDGIQSSINDMNNLSVQKKYLFIITDGEFSSELVGDVQKKIGEITANGDVSVLVGLICPEKPSLRADISEWQTKINGINGAAYLYNTIEDAGRQLLENLNLFLPHSIAKSPGNYQIPISISGSYTSSQFQYWNRDRNNIILNNITDSTAGESWDVSETQHVQTIRPLNGCPKHDFSIPNPGDHWLLFIQARTFQELKLILTTEAGKPLEVVNNNSLIFNVQIDDSLFPEYDLRNWSDCFLIGLVSKNGEPINGFVTPIPYEGSRYMRPDDVFEKLYGNLQWYPPPFTNPGEVEIKINLRAKDGFGPTWEGVYSLPIKFESVYYPLNNTPVVVTEEDVIQRSITFVNVASQPEIYLVTDLSQDKLIQIRNEDVNRQFQKLDYLVDEKEAASLLTSDHCQLSEEILFETYVCVLLYSNQIPTSFTYIFNSFEHIVKEYHFNKLLFVWKEENGAKAKAWMCNVDLAIVTCDSLMAIPRIEKK
ncbi:MAG: VWA domain-containing protein [Anaerolineales bacterium]|nr:VWA domain-containing protein [Anaerolineales bacterium]